MYEGSYFCASTVVDREQPRCSITTFLYRVAFTVFHASFFMENVRKSVYFKEFIVKYQTKPLHQSRASLHLTYLNFFVTNNHLEHTWLWNDRYSLKKPFTNTWKKHFSSLICVCRNHSIVLALPFLLNFLMFTFLIFMICTILIDFLPLRYRSAHFALYIFIISPDWRHKSAVCLGNESTRVAHSYKSVSFCLSFLGYKS